MPTNNNKYSNLFSGLIGAVFMASFATNTQASETQYQQLCVACHGADGAGNAAMQAPAIAGLDKEYLQRQLAGFKTGLRGHNQDDSSGQVMAGMVAMLSDKDTESLSGYIAQLPIVKLEQESKATGFRGRGLYSGCSSCHGAKGEGSSALGAPRLSQQYTWYLKKQLNKFRQDIRGNTPKDHYGNQMSTMAKDIASDSDIETLVNYIARLGK